MENFFPSMWKVRELADKVTNVVMNYTEVEAKVREATNEEPWGPTGQIMQELAHSTFTYEHFPEVMSMLWKRMLQDNKQHWRRTYKSLLLLNYLIKNGSERVVTSAREHIYDLRSLENYTFIDDIGKDQGVNIRHKVKELIEFVQDDDRLREERKKAKKNKDKFIGMSSDTFGTKFGTGHETWDDRSSYAREPREEDWDDTSNSANRYTDKSFEEEFEVDTKDESDSEARNNAHNNGIKRFQDVDIPSSPRHVDNRVNININTSLNNSPKKLSKPLKKVDLGAAANFGRDASQSPLPPIGNDLLNDDFNPRAAEAEKVPARPSQEFGDFETAFSNTSDPTHDVKIDNFADFSSAFSSIPTRDEASQNSSVPNAISPSNASPNLLLSNAPPSLFGALESAPASRNSDLLSDLDFGSLSVQSPLPPNNNFGFMGSSNDDLISTDTERGGSNKISARCVLARRLRDFVGSGEKAGRITTENQLEDVLLRIERIVELLPGPLTVQKVFDVDDDCLSENLDGVYRRFLECLLAYFDDNFPVRDDKVFGCVRDLLCAEDRRVFYITFVTFVNALSANSDWKMAELLQMILESDGLFSFLIHHSLREDDFKRDEDTWSNFVTILVTLPNRISNVLEGNVPNFFQLSRYPNFLLMQFLRTVEFLSDMLLYQKEEKFINYSKLSLLLGRIISDFNENTKSLPIKYFIEIIALLTNKSTEKMNNYRQIIRNVLLNLKRFPINVLAKMILLTINPEKYLIKNLFGKELLQNKNWEFALCTKLPLLTNFERDYRNLILNLTLYLSSNAQSPLLKLFDELLTIWGDKSALRHTSTEQQLFTASFILYLFNSMQNIGLSDHETARIREKAFAGITVHLESNVPAIRVSGMKVGEIIVNYLAKDDSESELKFEYDALNEECKNIVGNLEEIWREDLQVYFKEKTSFDLIEDVVGKLVGKEEKRLYIAPERKFRKKPVEEEPKNNLTVSNYKRQPDERIKIIDSTDFQLDSDDDLEPYDTSNDISSSKKVPAYLRDLRDGLVDTEDYELFAQSLRNCERLVGAQLPDDDPAIGLEILEILLSLEPKVYVDDFEDLMFRSAVAVTSVYPSVYAEHLCKQIHSDIGTFSISRRVFMLNVLRQTAKNLSVIEDKVGDEQRAVKSKKREELKSAEEVIRKRLESKTRYFGKKFGVKREQANRFAECAGCFFFPLIYGYPRNEMLSGRSRIDGDFVLLIHFIETLGTVMCAAQNCPVAAKMAKEIFHFSWFLRFHEEVKVRTAVLSLIASAVINVPKFVLLSEFMDQLFEIRLWLSNVLSPNGEPNVECRSLAACAVVLIDSVLKQETDVDLNNL
ncbi:unnamed protein product [Phyllotreta striolata]|uniref:ENTH domain-containing protein n=1 Tax=Phyllotreta striolata TaxID=444603 RepID=A0A9P0GSV5_PHYSR|nr:unnamed protein product [Phyllotreta striolata]